MGLLRGIRRVAPVAAAGLAAGWFLKRQGLLGAADGPEPSLPPRPSPSPPAPEVAPDEQGAEEDEPLEAHVEAVEAVSDAADVTTVVEDLLAAAPGEGQEMGDVEGEEPPDLAENVQAALADVPGLLPGSVRVEAAEGVVWLRGQLARPEMIAEAGRRAAAAPGVTEVRNLLHVPGTPPPAGA